MGSGTYASQIRKLTRLFRTFVEALARADFSRLCADPHSLAHARAEVEAWFLSEHRWKSRR